MQNNYIKIIKKLIKFIPEDTVDKNNNNILHILAELKDEKLMENILEDYLKNGSIKNLINNKNEDGNTVLHLAAEKKNNNVIDLLIDYGANPRITNNKGLFLANRDVPISNQSGGSKPPRSITPIKGTRKV